MQITVLTLFPEYFSGPFSTSILKRGQQNQLVDFQLIDIRDFATDKHQTTDDRPYGGGPGMVMKVEPIALALESIGAAKGTPGQIIALTAANGTVFTQQVARQWSELEKLILICGHYEGVDQRVADNLIDTEMSIGPFVLTGGEPAAAVMVDAVARLLPGVLGNEISLADESHNQPGYSASPQYTRPEEFRGWKVPEILLQGHHAKIKQWRSEQSSTSSNK